MLSKIGISQNSPFTNFLLIGSFIALGFGEISTSFTFLPQIVFLWSIILLLIIIDEYNITVMRRRISYQIEYTKEIVRFYNFYGPLLDVILEKYKEKIKKIHSHTDEDTLHLVYKKNNTIENRPQRYNLIREALKREDQIEYARELTDEYTQAIRENIEILHKLIFWFIKSQRVYTAEDIKRDHSIFYWILSTVFEFSPELLEQYIEDCSNKDFTGSKTDLIIKNLILDIYLKLSYQKDNTL